MSQFQQAQSLELSGSLEVFEAPADVDARLMRGVLFMVKRTFRHGGQRPLPGTRTFLEGLRVVLLMADSPTYEEIAADHLYTKTWMSDIIRRLEGRGPGGHTGITRETVVMLRESIPALHMQMQAGSVLWPELAEFDDYSVRRPGVQTAERLRIQARRRRAG